MPNKRIQRPVGKKPAIETEWYQKKVERALRDEVIEIKSVGDTSDEVSRVKLASGRTIISRFYSDASRKKRERIERIRKVVGSPPLAPTIGRTLRGRIQFQSFIEGENLSERFKQKKVTEKDMTLVASALSRLQRIRSTDAKSFQEVVRQVKSRVNWQVKKLVESKVISESEANVIRTKLSNMPKPTVGLTHTDFHAGNIIMDEKNDHAFIVDDEALSKDIQEITLAKIAHEMKSVYRAYQSIDPVLCRAYEGNKTYWDQMYYVRKAMSRAIFHHDVKSAREWIERVITE